MKSADEFKVLLESMDGLSADAASYKSEKRKSKFDMLIKDLKNLAGYLDSFGSSSDVDGSIAASDIMELVNKYTKE